MRLPRALTRLLQRALALLAQVLGVVLLLFLILESGLVGDPAERALGERPSLRRLGEFRVESGEYRRFEARAMELSLVGAPGRVSLIPQGGTELAIEVTGSDQIAKLELEGRTLAELPAALEALPLADDRRLQARLLDAELGALPAIGWHSALRGTRLIVDSRRAAIAPWAEARPAWQRFLHQTGELLRFDFGRSLDGQLVARELSTRSLRSLALALPALLLGTLLALGAAVLAARRPGGRIDRNLGRSAMLVIAVSGVSWVLLLRGLFAAHWSWFPVTAWDPPSLHALLLPILIWAFLATWPDFQVYRQILVGASRAPHLQAARARGLDNGVLWRRHLLQASSAALLAHFVLALPFLVLGSLILEQVFVVPGLGAYLVDAARHADAAVLRATTFLVTLLYLLFQELGDLGSRWLDPRFRGELRS